MMEQEAVLVRAILDDPHDGARRLVYADWLEEHGDPRGEYLRIRAEIARGDVTPERWARKTELEAVYSEAWLKALRPFNPDRVRISFDGVGAESIAITDGDDGEFAVLCRAPGVRALALENCRLTPTSLRLIAGLRQLDSLTISATPFPLARLRMLDGLPPWTAIRIEDEAFTDVEWAEFQRGRIERVARFDADGRRQAALRFLTGVIPFKSPQDGKRAYFSGVGVSDAELRFLSWLPDLEEVGIDASRRVTTSGLQHLAGSARLQSLSVYRTNVDSLAPITTCSSLQSLEFGTADGVTLSDEGTAGLERLTNLEQLDLKCQGGERTVERVGSLRGLKWLDLEVGTVEADGCLAALGNLHALERLSLFADAPFRGDSLRHLAGLRRLETLVMVLPTGDGVRHLAALPALRALEMYGPTLTAGEARALAGRLPGVRVFLNRHELRP